MRRLKVYICGPISKGDLLENINQANKAFQELANAGYAPWCPHWSCFSGYPFRDYEGGIYAEASSGGCGLDHATWLAIDCEWVKCADAVLRLPGESEGADEECRVAYLHNIPVVRSIEELSQIEI